MYLKSDRNPLANSHRLSLAALFSIGLHAGLLLAWLGLAQFKSKEISLEVIPFTAQDLQALKEKIKTENKTEDKLKVVRDTRHQIVNTDQNGLNESPKDHYYLGKSNQTFARQTAARHNGSYSPGARGGAASFTQKVKPAAIDPHKLGLGKSIFASPPKVANTQNIAGNPQGDLKAHGPAASNDFIENLPLGDLAQLNTQEFKYFGFYDRIRQKLEQFWGVALKEKAQGLYRQGRHIAAGQRITSLQVILDRQGNIIKVLIKAASGIRELDEAAIESFRKAGPFPNPPQGMLQGGYASIEWGFVVKS